MNRNSKFQNLLDFLISVKNNYDPLIFRKEIAAWSAVVLYLPLLFAFYSFVKVESNNSFLICISVFLVIICGLFLLFLNKQYDSIFNLQATRNVLTYWIYRMIDKDDIPKDFDLTILKKKNVPKSIHRRLRPAKRSIRKSKHLKIICVPWIVAFKFLQKLFGKRKGLPYDNIEIQESVIYNIIILFNYLDLLYDKGSFAIVLL